MTTFTLHLGLETLTRWLRDQQNAVAIEAEPVVEAEPADAVARLLLGLAFALGGYLLIQDATAVSGQLIVGYSLAGRAASIVVALVALRVGIPRILSGLRTVKKVRAREGDDQADDRRVDERRVDDRDEPEVEAADVVEADATPATEPTPSDDGGLF